MIHLLPALVLVALGAIFVITYRRRLKSGVPEQRFKLASELRPFVEIGGDARYMDGDELWASMGKIGGLWVICQAAGEILSEAIRRRELVPDNRTLASRSLVISFELRVVCLLCLGEALICKHLPILPRVFAWVVARLYCDLISTLQAMPSHA